jgi:tetratricopeptide (TPR) repeat protein
VDVRPQDLPYLLAEIASARAKIGDQQAAVDLFDRSLGALELPWEDKVEHRILFASLIEARTRAGDVAGALRTANAIAEAHMSAYGHELIATAQAEAGDFKGALETVDAIDSRKAAETKASAMVWVAIARAEAGNFDEALQIVVLIEAVQGDNEAESRRISGLRDMALHHIAVAQASSGTAASAAQTASRIRSEQFRLRTLCEIAAAQAGSGNSADAQITLEKAVGIAKPARDQSQLWSIASTQVILGDIKSALRTASSLAEGPEKGCALFDIAIAQKKAGDEDAATRTFEEGLRIVGKADVSEFGYALQEMATRFADAGDLNRTMQVIDLMKDEDSTKHVTLRMIATGRIKTDDDARALEIAGTISDAYHQAVAFREIAAAQAKAGNPASAETFRRAFEAACKMATGGGSDVRALYEIGSAQAAAGDVAPAAKTFEEARNRAHAYEGESYFAQLLQRLAKAQTKAGDAEGARAWAAEQASPIVKARSLLGVAEGLIKRDVEGERRIRSR